MTLRYLIIICSLLFFAGNLLAQITQPARLFIPFLDKESQSNVIVTLDLSDAGQSCPPEYTNVLTNTNLFTSEEQKLIGEAFVKYKNVTTNSGPPGTVLASLYKTNFVIKAMNRDWPVENWVVRYQYTNSEAYEVVTIGQSLSARFRTNSTDGYNVYFNRVGGGSTLRFIEVKHNLINGLFVEFEDTRAQGTAWDYRLADFSNSHVTEYRHYTNKMVIGKFFMWNPENNNLGLEAEFKEPYDFEKHRIEPHLP
jgi:hypothetical protein